jgi:ribose 1,5-bisphosphokinase PhnN
MTDYALPLLRTEQCLKEVHKAVLEKDLDKAKEKALLALEWLVETQIALRQMK